MGGSVLVEGRTLDTKKPTTSRLGRAVRATVDRSTESPMIGKEKHSTNNSLRDVILGGQDGLVNMLGIALGVVAAGSTHVLVVTGKARNEDKVTYAHRIGMRRFRSGKRWIVDYDAGH